MGRMRDARGGSWFVVTVVVVVGVAALAAVVFLARPAAQEPVASQGGGSVTEDTSDLRVVTVEAVDTGQVSDVGRDLRASLLEGVMPAGRMLGTVLSDANCEPDAAGVSHCRNEIQLDSGTMFVVRHNHRMAEVACLAPGERVVVQPA